ncbi:MAG: 23S rRNA (pseudouridine(1915)-N(3))-methyltransferase RlmH [Burkholderiaceae bacterium]|jgi:23S rRNA (pseudouridine1915-N3)-methyltransferase
MQLHLLAVGTKQPRWVEEAYREYADRFPGEFPLTLKEIKAEPRTLGKTVEAMMQAEASRVRQALPPGSLLVTLDEHGKTLTSVALAQQLDRWRLNQHTVSFVIGGPDGLDPTLKSESACSLRLSDFTLPHGMARVILVEQLYRAWSILAGHPYHRA